MYIIKTGTFEGKPGIRVELHTDDFYDPDVFQELARAVCSLHRQLTITTKTIDEAFLKIYLMYQRIHKPKVKRAMIDIKARRAETKRCIDERAQREWMRSFEKMKPEQKLKIIIKEFEKEIGMAIPEDVSVCLKYTNKTNNGTFYGKYNIGVIIPDNYRTTKSEEKIKEIFEFVDLCFKNKFVYEPTDKIKAQCSGTYIKA